MYTVVNWDKVQMEIRPKKHKYRILEGGLLWWTIVIMEVLLVFVGLAAVTFVVLYFGM